jgi:hypothetical protein
VIESDIYVPDFLACPKNVLDVDPRGRPFYSLSTDIWVDKPILRLDISPCGFHVPPSICYNASGSHFSRVLPSPTGSFVSFIPIISTILISIVSSSQRRHMTTIHPCPWWTTSHQSRIWETVQFVWMLSTLERKTLIYIHLVGRC